MGLCKQGLKATKPILRQQSKGEMKKPSLTQQTQQNSSVIPAQQRSSATTDKKRELASGRTEFRIKTSNRFGSLMAHDAPVGDSPN